MELKESLQIKGAVRITKYDSRTGDVLYQSDWMDNLVVENSGSGVSILVSGMSGGSQVQVDEGKIGTDNTSPADGDTDLGSVTVDGLNVQSTTTTTNEVTFSFFIPSSDLPNGDYEEFGVFVDGALLARSLLSNTYTKASNEDTRIDHKITLTN